ncbi:MAG TPA: hypothetical protein VGB92_02495 [Longimicrobium sp.]|jgi:hypothetical protein
MEPRSDRLLKRVWLVNGFILLALGVLSIGMLLFTFLGETFWSRSEPAVRVTAGKPDAASAPRAIRYGAPAAVRGTPTRLVTVHHGEADQSITEAYADGGNLSSGRGAYHGPGPIVNVIFLTPGAPQGRILLDHPAFIDNLHYPSVERRDPYLGPGSGGAVDSLQTWISYEIADRDTNRDGKLSAADQAGLFVSALDGTGLRRVLPDPFQLISHEPTPDGRGLLVMALEPPRGKEVKQEEMRQRSFIFDLASGRLVPYAILDSATDRAARIVGR